MQNETTNIGIYRDLIENEVASFGGYLCFAKACRPEPLTAMNALSMRGP